ncbi:MAG: murein L,D-transpeptidase catalytic domain family protein [Bacteroidetes bacterium]|nr:murein L,D-transpeptidase catalytic domain family protein [Bacteroidota bacterium]
MKLLMKLSTTILLLFTSIAALAYLIWYKPNTKPAVAKPKTVTKKEDNKALLLRLKQQADVILTYAKAHQYNTTYCFLVDMKVESGKKRFFVYNLQKDSVETSGLVTHGGGRTGNDIQFSNTPNSLCTSLGKYKIGGSYTGRFGLAFKLYGLDATNSKAYERAVVLHSHSCVPNDETAPYPICTSWGCPTVAPAFLTSLKTYLDNAGEPVLLDIYY